MCNLSKGVLDKGIKLGIEQGIEQGAEKEKIKTFLRFRNTTDWSDQRIFDFLEIPENERAAFLEKIKH